MPTLYRVPLTVRDAKGNVHIRTRKVPRSPYGYRENAGGGDFGSAAGVDTAPVRSQVATWSPDKEAELQQLRTRVQGLEQRVGALEEGLGTVAAQLAALERRPASGGVTAETVQKMIKDGAGVYALDVINRAPKGMTPEQELRLQTVEKVLVGIGDAAEDLANKG